MLSSFIVSIIEKLKKVCSRPKDREQTFFMPLLISSFGVSKIRNRTLFVAALTHNSFHETSLYNHQELHVLNERLEFLGDAVLELIVSDYLCVRFPCMEEGKLTRLRANIVCRDNLNLLGHSIDLGNFIRLDSKTCLGENVIGNAYEAIMGAIYLEQGYAYVRRLFVKRVLESGFIDWESLQGELYDYRSMVLHWSQKEKKRVEFIYEILSRTPPLFECTLLVDGEEKIRGCGRKKKLAVQEVCRLWLEELGRANNEDLDKEKSVR